MSRPWAVLMQRDTGQRASGSRSPGRSRTPWHAPPRPERDLRLRDLALLALVVIAAIAAIIGLCSWLVSR